VVVLRAETVVGKWWLVVVGSCFAKLFGLVILAFGFTLGGAQAKSNALRFEAFSFVLC
jgi:hypothetical protein